MAVEDVLVPDRSELDFSRVLVVDDEEALRHVLDLLFRREGFEVLEASSGEQAVEVLQRERVDVMFCDVRMPGMGGLALIEKAKEQDPDLTVIVMSAFGSVELGHAGVGVAKDGSDNRK